MTNMPIQLYRCILFRNPAQSEIDYWSNFLTNNTRTRIQEVNDFLASTEFISGIKLKLNAISIVVAGTSIENSKLEQMASVLQSIKATIDELMR